MCIINEPAQVTKTQIFVAPSQDHKTQITVYCNKVMTESSNNVMVLPVPFPNSLKFIDLSHYKDMFKDLERSFKLPTQSALLSFSANSLDSYLPTIDVGSYRITVSPNIAKLNEVNPNEFGKIQDHIKTILEKHYHYCGFIVCKLIPGKETEYHPLAYSHRIWKDLLFVPTRHQHNHAHNHRVSYNESSILGYPSGHMGHVSHEESESDWDHEIYSINTVIAASNCQIVDPTLYLNLNKFDGFKFGGVKSLNKYKINGYYPNRDVFFEMVK